MSSCTLMLAVQGDPENPHECGHPAFPTSEPPRCVAHIMEEMVHQVEAYQVGVDAARAAWAVRGRDETAEFLLAEANQVLALLEGTGQQAIRTRGYRDTLTTICTTETAK